MQNHDDERKQGDGTTGRRPDPGEDGEKFAVTPEIDVRDRDEGYHRIPSSDEMAMGRAGRRHPDLYESEDDSAREASDQGPDEDKKTGSNEPPAKDAPGQESSDAEAHRRT